MNEIAKLLDEYAAIPDKESLYARVLMSCIKDREKLLRAELDRQIMSSNKNRERRATLRHLIRFQPLERLVELYMHAQ